MNAYLLSVLPLVAAFALLLMVGPFRPGKSALLTNAICILGISGSAMLMWLTMPTGMEYFGGAIRVTAVGKVVAYVAMVLCLLGIIMSEDYLDKIRVIGVEFRMIVLGLTLGLMHLALAGDLATLFIAFELVSIPSYVLVAFNHRDARANEAGMKYLLLGAFASALFLLGIAFLYGATGSIYLSEINMRLSTAVEAGREGDIMFAKIALAFFLGSLLFKVGSAPFHTWLPEVYQGSNLASLAFIASPAKIGIFGLLAMLLWGPFQALYEVWKPALLVAAAACAVLGNLQAISQIKLKRILAFSSVANAGFLLLAFVAGGKDTILLYLTAYGLTTLGAVAAFMAFGTAKADVEELSDLQGLGARHPVLATLFTLVLLSFAGLPLTAGFAAKLGVAVDFFRPGSIFGGAANAVLVLSLTLSLISFYFYFKIVRALWMKPEGSGEAEILEARERRPMAVFSLGLCACAIVALGVVMRLPGA